MRPSPPSHPSAQQSPHSQPPSHGQMLSNQVRINIFILLVTNVYFMFIFYFSLLWVLGIQVDQDQVFACHN